MPFSLAKRDAEPDVVGRPEPRLDDARLSEETEETEDALHVAFTLDAKGRYEKDGFAVYPNTLLFRAANYPDKKFHAKPADLTLMAASVATEQPCGNIEHKDFLRGRAGVISKAWTADAGKTLRGMVKVPLALDALLDDQERKVSLEINKTTKAVKAFALTTKPRVDDAVLMSVEAGIDADINADIIKMGGASRHDTNQGQRAMQEMHDNAVRHGAVCKADNAVARFASEHEHEGVQAMHDLSCEHGAKCDKVGKPAPTRPSYMYYSRDIGKSGKTNPEPKPAAGRPAPRATNGAKPVPNNKTPKSTREKVIAAVRALFSRSEITPEEQAELDARLEDVDFSFLEENSDKLDTQTQNLVVSFNRLKANSLHKDAETWADRQIADKRALPAERGPMVAAYLFAAQDDEANPETVTFSVGEEKTEASRVETIQALFAQRAPHQLFDELLKTPEGLEEAQVLFSKSETARAGVEKPVTPERRRKLLSATHEGRAILASEAK